MKIRPILWIVAALVLVANASALGIAPAEKSLRFEPNVTNSYTYTIINNEMRELDIVVSAVGELADFIQVPSQQIHLDSAEEEKAFAINVTLPSSLRPGENLGKIRITETTPKTIAGDNNVAVRLEVNSKISVNAPYPEKYILVDLKVNATSGSKPIKLTTDITNVGTTDIKRLRVNFMVRNENKTIADVYTDETPLARKETKTLSKEFRNLNLPEGEYSALATIFYDSSDITLIKDFIVGEMNVTILDYTKYFIQGELNKFEVLVKSDWNRKIKNAFAVIFIEGFEKIKSVSYDLDPFEEKAITSYWDTSNVSVGGYASNITLDYADKTVLKEGRVYVVDASELKALLEKPRYYIYIGAGLLILTLFNLLLFILMSRRRKGKDGRRKR